MDVATGKVLHLLTHPDRVVRCALTPDERHLLTLCGDGRVRVWNVSSGKEVRQLDGKHLIWGGLSVSRDGDEVVSQTEDNSATVFSNLATGKEVRRLSASLPLSVFMPDGQAYLAAGGGRLELRAARTGETVREFRGHRNSIRDITLSSDGQYAASCGGPSASPQSGRVADDCSVRVWNVGTGHLLWLRQESPYTRQAVAFSPDGARVVAGGNDRTVRVYETTSGWELACLDCPAAVLCVAVSPDGKSILAGGEDGVLRLYGMPIQNTK
jgi:WD40 repeat protein